MARMRWYLLTLCAGLLCTAAPTARADIYCFTEPGGAVHYSNVPVDARYVLLLIDPRPGPAARAAPPHRPGGANVYAGLIAQAARAAEVHPALISAVVAVESDFNPHAVSRKGARGLMQLLPQTAQRYGVRDAFDPGDNLRAGARYLSDLIQRYGSLALALAAYNAGEEAVERYGRAIPPFAETRAYVPSVLELYRQYLHAQGGD